MQLVVNSPMFIVLISSPMNEEIWPLVIDEPVEVQDFNKLTNQFKRIYEIYLQLRKKKLNFHIM